MGWPEGAIERKRFSLLECSGKPARLWTCRDTHGCSECLGWGVRRGDRCESCQGTGVGSIKAGSLDYCPCCSRCGVEDDPRLKINSGELPRREPEPKPEPAAKKRGRPKGSKNKPKQPAF
jgi:hypothetical protein